MRGSSIPDHSLGRSRATKSNAQSSSSIALKAIKRLGTTASIWRWKGTKRQFSNMWCICRGFYLFMPFVFNNAEIVLLCHSDTQCKSALGPTLAVTSYTAKPFVETPHKTTKLKFYFSGMPWVGMTFLSKQYRVGTERQKERALACMVSSLFSLSHSEERRNVNESRFQRSKWVLMWRLRK